MNFSQNSSLGSTASALLTLLKNYHIIDLKIELLATNMNITNDSRHADNSQPRGYKPSALAIELYRLLLG